MNTHSCKGVENTICQNKPGGFDCVCKDGFDIGSDNNCIEGIFGAIL